MFIINDLKGIVSLLAILQLLFASAVGPRGIFIHTIHFMFHHPPMTMQPMGIQSTFNNANQTVLTYIAILMNVAV